MVNCNSPDHKALAALLFVMAKKHVMGACRTKNAKSNRLAMSEEWSEHMALKFPDNHHPVYKQYTYYLTAVGAIKEDPRGLEHYVFTHRHRDALHRLIKIIHGNDAIIKTAMCPYFGTIGVLMKIEVIAKPT